MNHLPGGNHLIRPDEPPVVLTPCELNVCFSLPLTLSPPVCELEGPSCKRRLTGIPLEEPDEGILLYLWVNEEGQEYVPLFPNREDVLKELTIRFLAKE